MSNDGILTRFLSQSRTAKDNPDKFTDPDGWEVCHLFIFCSKVDAKTWQEKGQTKWWAEIGLGLEENAKISPLEVQLFSDFLATVPSWLRRDADSWAYVIVGFEQFCRSGAMRYTGSLVSQFEKDTVGIRRANPASAISNFFTMQKGGTIEKLMETSREAGHLMVYGPQIYNKKVYERVYGPPPHPWAEYGYGWQPPKVRSGE